MLPHCTRCGTGGARRLCGACSFAPYCSEVCAALDWPAHCAGAEEERVNVSASQQGVAPLNLVWAPSLWLGSLAALGELDAYHIDAVVTVLPRSSPHYDYAWLAQCVGSRPHLWLDHRDVASEDLARDFQLATSWIDAELRAGHAVLVHCAAGVSRSATVVAAYLLCTQRQRFASVEVVLQWLRERRSIVQPNTGFVAQLEGWRCNTSSH